MPVSPQARRAIERLAAERTAQEKGQVRALVEAVRCAVTPPLTTAELSLCLGGYAPPEGQRGGTTVGRWISESQRSRNALPDALQRAALEALVQGSTWLAVNAAPAPGARREVLICQPAEAERLGTTWTVIHLPEGPVDRTHPDWDDDDMFDPLGSAPPRRPRAKPGRTPHATGRPTPVRTSDGSVAPRLLLSRLVPPIGLGCMRLSTEGRPDRSVARDTILAALDGGCRLLDTADVYALDEADLGHNEALIGELLAEWAGPRDDVVVATKCGLARPGGRWIPSGRPERLRRQLEASAGHLGVSSLSLAQLHVVDPKVPLTDSLGALARAREDGLVEHIGVCNLSVAQLEVAASVVPLAAVQLPVSPWSPRSREAIAWAHARAIPVLAHSPIGGHRRIPRVLSDPMLSELAIEYETTPQAIVLAWLLHLGPGLLFLPGATRPHSATRSSQAQKLRLSEATLDRLDAEWSWAREARSETWGSASDPREVRIVMGPPASGKSSTVHPWVERGFTRLNRDEHGGRLDDLLPVLDAALSAGAPGAVLDNTYATRAARERIVDIAARHRIPARVTWLDADFGDCAYNASLRMLDRFDGTLPDPEEITAHPEANTIPPAAVTAYFNRFEPPSPNEGFASVDRVPFLRRPTPGATHRGLLLDLDGTLRRTLSGQPFPREPDDIELLPRRREILHGYRAAGYRLVGISNQSGVARGELTRERAEACFQRTRELLGLDFEILFCPHASGRISCWCRKPMPGLGVRAILEHQLDPSQTLMVGDLESDASFAEHCGIRFETAESFFSRSDHPHAPEHAGSSG